MRSGVGTIRWRLSVVQLSTKEILLGSRIARVSLRIIRLRSKVGTAHDLDSLIDDVDFSLVAAHLSDLVAKQFNLPLFFASNDFLIVLFVDGSDVPSYSQDVFDRRKGLDGCHNGLDCIVEYRRHGEFEICEGLVRSKLSSRYR